MRRTTADVNALALLFFAKKLAVSSTTVPFDTILLTPSSP